MEIEKLSNKDKKEYKLWLKSYKNVSRCNKCKKLFGHDKEKEELCYFCDPKTIKRFKDRN